MKLYADTPSHRARQILADVFVLSWVAAWVWLGRQVYELFVVLRTPADGLASAGESVRGAMIGAGNEAGGIPLVGDTLRGWFGQAAAAGTELTSAGTSMAETVETLGLLMGWVTALGPTVPLVGVWLWLRVRFARQATSAQRFIDELADLDLFALRAMARQPMTALARVSPDPAGAWRRGDPAVIRQLATLELRHQGLRPPPRDA